MTALSVYSRFALVGPGAVGLYYGGRLALSGVSLSVLARSDEAALSTKGIQIRMTDPNTGIVSDAYAAPLTHVSSDPQTIEKVDCVIIAAKSTVNADLIESLKPMVEAKRTVILTLQNGMGNAEYFAKHFPENPILSGLCFVCVNRTEPGVVENYHTGRVEIGSLNDQWPEETAAIVDLFNLSDVMTKHAESLDAALWRKLCWNVPFNGLSIAAGAITTDLILQSPEQVKRARDLMEEIRAAASKAGHAISDRFIDGQFEVTANMGAYKPSSLIDYLDGRPVEVEAIWGEPLRRGRALDVPMPELEKLHKELGAAIPKN